MEKAIENFFKVFGNIDRFKILLLLLKQPMNAKNISKAINMEKTLLSHNLKILKDAKVIDFEKKGNERIYYINEKIRVIIITFKMILEKFIIFYKANE